MDGGTRIRTFVPGATDFGARWNVGRVGQGPRALPKFDGEGCSCELPSAGSSTTGVASEPTPGRTAIGVVVPVTFPVSPAAASPWPIRPSGWHCSKSGVLVLTPRYVSLDLVQALCRRNPFRVASRCMHSLLKLVLLCPKDHAHTSS